MKLVIEKLNASHVKKKFDCDYPLLNGYLHNQAKQDFSRDLSVCYVLCTADNNTVIGYYTLSSNSISRSIFPEDIIKKLPPSYSELPTILLGRLAVDSKEKNKGYGEILLLNALNNCFEFSKNIGALSVIVDPIDKQAFVFYQKYGFIKIPSGNKMFLPIKTIESLLK
jgi:predicted GNAT family N-acyltransferase